MTKNLKFKRTYIGGSKAKENKIFSDVQGTNDNDCDLLKYREIFNRYFIDKLTIYNSYKILFRFLGYLLALISLLLITMKDNLFIYVFLLSVIFQFLSWVYKRIHNKNLTSFNVGKSMLGNEINNMMGFNVK